MKFGIYLVKRGLIDPDTLVKAIEIQLAQRPLLGTLAVETGKISMRNVFEILGEQADKQVPFGDIAVEKQFLSRKELAELILIQLEKTPSLVDILVDIRVMNKDSVNQELSQFRSLMSAHSNSLDDIIFGKTLAQSATSTK